MLAQRFFAVFLVGASALQVAAVPVKIPKITEVAEKWKNLPEKDKVNIAVGGAVAVTLLTAYGLAIAVLVEQIKQDIKFHKARESQPTTRLVDGKTPGGRGDSHA